MFKKGKGDMTKYYTGVGSRSTPQDIMELVTQVATKLEALGYSLRSGAADGADTGFENGVTNPLNKQIFIAWEGFSSRYSSEKGVYNVRGQVVLRAEEIASSIHPLGKGYLVELKDFIHEISFNASGLH